MTLRVGGAFFPKRISSPALRYTIATLGILLVFLLTFIFWNALGRRAPIVLFFFAIAVTSWYVGRGPGLVAGALSIIAIDLVLQPDRSTWVHVVVYARIFAFCLFALMVSALRDAGDKYRRDQERLLELERQGRAVAEQSALLHQQVEDRLTVLVKASGALLTSLESESVLSRVMELAKQFVEADAYAIWRRNAADDGWEAVFTEGLSEEYRSRFLQDLKDLPDEPWAVPDLYADDRFASRIPLYNIENIRGLLLMPLRTHSKQFGGISYYYRAAHDISEGDVRIATALSNLAGSALLIAGLYEEQLALRAEAQQVSAELQDRNMELQQFAYVVSHDLQEPLRMIGSYVKLLAKRYHGHLDEEADEFIGYVTGGVDRMQALIRDLLAYSRVMRQDRPPAEVPLEEVLEDVILNMRPTLEKEQARITHDPLPSVVGERAQFVQLLQNLISNAVKYRRDVPPEVHLSAKAGAREWTFSVSDNGIGIDPRHFDRVFGIFKRLHGADYPGTGIGLAISKRIVEKLHGRIWIESQVGEGSTFYFTVPTEAVKKVA